MLKDLQEYCTCISDPAFVEAIKIIGFSHDIGKSTFFFQEYLHNPNIKFNPFLKSHSTLSSIYAYYVTRNKGIDDNFLSFLIPMLIQGHHGKIPSSSTVIKRLDDHREELKVQFRNVLYVDEIDYATDSEKYPNFLNSKKILEYQLYDFHTKLKVPFDLSIKKYGQSLMPYFIANMLFSILIDADRLDAAKLDVKKRSPLDYQLVSDYIDRIEKETLQKFGDTSSNIINLRMSVRKIVLQKLSEVEENKILLLTAPTGSGKTLTAFLFANALRNRIYERTNRYPRIIYVLPFLSIIDQNSKVIQEALGLKDGSQTNKMITHHHLSKLEYYDVELEEESYSSAESALLIEGWNSEVIVTTFVQFLETIISTSASSLRKLHNIAGSIIILDEVQSIDYRYWLLVHDCLKFWTEEFDTRIIFMTATQPLIFDRESEEIPELCDIEQRGLYQERVHLKLERKTVYIDEFIEKINRLIHEDDDSKSVLIIMNTIRSAIYVFENVHGHDYEKFYLSAEVLPVERQERIKAISNRLEKRQRTILISTQVVEAGVDFDFDIAIRDIAPIDSIVQAAGRCNRHGLRPREDSPVYVFDVYDEKNNSFAPRIYGNYLIEKTRETFREAENRIFGGDLRLSDLVNIYYHKVKKGGSKQASNDVLTEMKKLNYDDLKFKVVEDEPSISIFIEINDEAENVWQEYQAIIKIVDVVQKGKRLRSFFRVKRHIFYNYVISSYPEIVESLGMQFKKPFFYVEKRLLPNYYNVTGLRRN